MSEAVQLLFIATLLGVIGFLVQWMIKHISEKSDENTKSINATNEKLNDSINKLQMTLTGLNGIILSLQTENELSAKSCGERHSSINDTLVDHEERIRGLEKTEK